MVVHNALLEIATANKPERSRLLILIKKKYPEYFSSLRTPQNEYLEHVLLNGLVSELAATEPIPRL